MASIPIIDMSPYGTTDRHASRSVVDRVSSACRDIGFFLIVGHGVGEDVQLGLYDAARDFFDRTVAAKTDIPVQGDLAGGLSYLPIAREALSGTIGKAGPGDYKESLNYGPRLPGGAWPADCETLNTSFRSYFRAMEDLSRRLRSIFCDAIDLPNDYFEADFEEHLSALRVINYPEQVEAPIPGQVRAGEHTDYGFLTILRSEASAGGLQVRSRDGQWIDAPAIDGAFVINIGDAFMRWTNDTWISTPHRVVNPPLNQKAGTRRQSIPFFLNPRKETVIRCLPAFCDADHRPRYPDVTYGEYIQTKTRQANG